MSCVDTGCASVRQKLAYMTQLWPPRQLGPIRCIAMQGRFASTNPIKESPSEVRVTSPKFAAPSYLIEILKLHYADLAR
jgi:hypothetical protein